MPEGEVQVGGRCLLFLPGEPLEAAAPGARARYVSVAIGGGAPWGATSWGGRQPGDDAPGQVFGEAGRIGRLVLDVARRNGLSVKVVNVNDPGDDRVLTQRHLGPDDALPVLIRPDGARLAGEESFVPSTLERFLARH